MKLGGLLVFVIMLAMFSGFVRHERRRAREEQA
jgi:hypothetical protein